MSTEPNALPPLSDAACTCRVTGQCPTCLRWHEVLTGGAKRRAEYAEAMYRDQRTQRTWTRK